MWEAIKRGEDGWWDARDGVSKWAWLEWRVVSPCYGTGGKKRATYQRLKGSADGIEPRWVNV